MTTEQKLNKLIDLLMEWSGSGMFLYDLNYRLKEISSSGCAEHDICPGCLGKNGCMCALKPKTEEIKPDVTTSEEKEECKHFYMTDLVKNERYCVLCTLRETVPPTPWLPNPGDSFCTIHPAYNLPHVQSWGSPKPTRGQLALWKLGLVFKTFDEAEAKINSLLNL